MLVFLDRDGVINRNRADHVKSWHEFEFLPGSLTGLALLHRAGYRTFVITNQAVINRGVLSSEDLDNIHRRLLAQVERAGGKIEAVLYCPHRPEENCGCRKPRPGLLEQVRQRYSVAPEGSWLVGDHANDIAAGLQAGCRTILVLSGRTVLGQTGGVAQPHYVRTDLAAAARFIIEQDKALQAVALAAAAPLHGFQL